MQNNNDELNNFFQKIHENMLEQVAKDELKNIIFEDPKKMMMITNISTHILNEFYEIIDKTFQIIERKDNPKEEERKNIKFELMTLNFWLFETNDIFPITWADIIVMEMYKQYFERLKKENYIFNQQILLKRIDLRYKTYNEICEHKIDLIDVIIKFIQTTFDIKKRLVDNNYMEAMVFFIKKTNLKFKEMHEIAQKNISSVN